MANWRGLRARPESVFWAVMTKGRIIAERDGAVGRLIFDSPARRNAVSHDMWLDAAAALADFAADGTLRVLVVTGAGRKAFSAGDDIADFAASRDSAEADETYRLAGAKALALLDAMPCPTIAMIRGYCIGGGVETAITCDLRIAADTARFAIPAARLGLGYEMRGIARLIALVGPSFAKEIFFTARQFNAEEARDMKLVNRVVPTSLLRAFVDDYAKTIAANAPLTVAQVKHTVGEILKDPGDRNIEKCAEMVRACFDSEDFIEGRDAFMEKRAPVFKAR